MRYYDSPRGPHGGTQAGDESLGQQILRVISNVGFAFFVLAVLTITVIAVTYQPPDPLVQHAGELTTLLSSVHNATFKPDDTLIITGDDARAPAAVVAEGAITEQDAQDDLAAAAGGQDHRTGCENDEKVDCADPGVKAAIEYWNSVQFPKLLFFKYRRPVPVPDEPMSCDVAWKYRSLEDQSTRLFRDYRRFKLRPGENCSYVVKAEGGWHSGKEAKPRFLVLPAPPPPVTPEDDDDGGLGGDGQLNLGEAIPAPAALSPLVEADQAIEIGVDTVQVIEPLDKDPESEFQSKKYLLYDRGGDWCKPVSQFQWSFLCALGEARYLGRTFVMDLDFCPNPYKPDEVKDFRMYFDFEHLRNETPVVEQGAFWSRWNEYNTGHPGDHLQVRLFRIPV